MVTLIADNYYGYCKKEVKTQIGYACNLYGFSEEEHAGGALAFPSYNLGDDFRGDSRAQGNGATFADVVAKYGDLMTLHADGYGVDKIYPDVFYLPEDAIFRVKDSSIAWTSQGVAKRLRLKPGLHYVLPSGYQVRIEKHPNGPSWRLIGIEPEGTFCHKPCTVSGGGKSEISKSIADAVIFGPVFVGHIEDDLLRVQEVLNRDFSDRHLPQYKPDYTARSSRSILSTGRSLGSVIKLLTPSAEEFTPEYNAWLNSIPPHVLNLVFVVKRFYREEWGANWRTHFTVDIIDGHSGHELKYDGRKLNGAYLRIGYRDDGSWRTFKLRQDFIAAEKLQMEDDITASVVVPSAWLAHQNPAYAYPSVKISENCEYRFFQRPDEAIHRGYDKQAEFDLSGGASGGDVFVSNFEALDTAAVSEMVEDAVGLARFTEPMRRVLTTALKQGRPWTVCSANPRMVDGKPSKNPRYLQTRQDLVEPGIRYRCEVATRLARQVPLGKPVHWPVNAMLPGRRNNAGDAKSGVRPLSCYNPIHHQELPELFMEFISSLTGKSPSTTGAGSEGALTKGPFNALPGTADLNNALVGMLVTGYQSFTTSAGTIGERCRVDHDISLLIPEIWCRLAVSQRDPAWLIKEGYLEVLKDFTYDGRTVLASRLGYRITARFVHTFFGKVFSNPASVLDEAMLKPETQDMAAFVDSIENIVEAQRNVAAAYIADGTIAFACPPLQALLHIMATGSFQGMGISHPEVRRMFTREYLLSSDWYRARLVAKQSRDVALWDRHISSLGAFLARPGHREVAERLDIADRLARAKAERARVAEPAYVDGLVGTIGADTLPELAR